jgi:hypothetical protein
MAGVPAENVLRGHSPKDRPAGTLLLSGQDRIGAPETGARKKCHWRMAAACDLMAIRRIARGHIIGRSRPKTWRTLS